MSLKYKFLIFLLFLKSKQILEYIQFHLNNNNNYHSYFILSNMTEQFKLCFNLTFK